MPRSLLSIPLVAALFALGVPAAFAGPLTLGQTSATGGNCTTAYAYTQIQPQVAAGASYVVPEAGVITAWSHFAGASGSGQMQLKVYRPTSTPNSYQVVRESPLEKLTPNVLNSFPVSLGVQAGDLIGYTRPANSTVRCMFSTGLSGDLSADAPSADDPLGTTTKFNAPGSGARVNLSAVFYAYPVVEAVTPPSSSVLGGGTITLTGHDFTDASGVDFAGLPAAAFTVVSDTRIDVVVPKRNARDTVDVFVHGPAGRSFVTAGDRFTFVGCRVPTLARRTLAKAKERIKAEGCRVGKVRRAKGATAKTGRVVKQNPKPTGAGDFLAPGTKVSIKLGIPPRR